MATRSEDVAMAENDAKIHEPFTVEENIHQLNAIDETIVQLMNHTAVSLKALTIPTSPNTDGSAQEGSRPEVDAAAQKEAFHSAADSFLTALHTIDVRMKRQILALDEAGIINLANSKSQEPGKTKKSTLKPNGVGAIGKLDIGLLNSRSSRVERDMELELWKKAREFLTQREDSETDLAAK